MIFHRFNQWVRWYRHILNTRLDKTHSSTTKGTQHTLQLLTTHTNSLFTKLIFLLQKLLTSQKLTQKKGSTSYVSQKPASKQTLPKSKPKTRSSSVESLRNSSILSTSGDSDAEKGKKSNVKKSSIISSKVSVDSRMNIFLFLLCLQHELENLFSGWLKPFLTF